MTEPTHVAKADRRALVWPIAGIAVAVAAGLAAWGTFGGDGDDAGDYLVVLAVIGVATAVVFGWVVPRTFRSAAFGLNGLVLAIAGLVSVVIFWSGLPPILGLAGAFLGWVGRERRADNVATAALVVGVLALVADVLIYIQDQT